MQGGSGRDTAKNDVLYYFMDHGYDIICLQEATNHLNSFSLHTNGHHGIDIYHQLPSEGGRHPSSNQYTCYFYRWGTGNDRCSLATYVKNGNIGNTDYGIVEYYGKGRPMLWVRVNIDFSLVHIGNIHLPSGKVNVANEFFTYFRNHMYSMSRPFVIAGDFNMDLPYIQANFIDHNYFHHPGIPTQQSGNTLDYVYSTEPVSVDGHSDAFHSDHRYLKCTIS